MALPDLSERLLEQGYPAQEAEPARNGLPPGGGRLAVPHYQTFTQITNLVSRSYRWRFDEALKHNRENALAMRRDALIMDCMRARTMPTAQAGWHLECENKDDARQQQAIARLTTIVQRTPRFQKLKMSLLEAVWYGRYATQQIFQWDYSADNIRQLVVRDFTPINGDKLIFKFGGRPGILVHRAEFKGETQPTDRGPAHFLNDSEREQFCIHAHEIEDGDYYEGLEAGGIHGVGVRHRIYWIWWLKQEVLSWMCEFLERVGMGIWLFYYESGNPDSEKQARIAAEQQSRNNIVVWPRPIGSEKQGAGVEFIQPNMSGADFLVKLITDYFDSQIRSFILGQTLSSKAEATGLGSSVADAHMQTLDRILRFDADNLAETITRDLIGVLQKYNYPELPKGCIRFVFDLDKPNPKEFLDAAKTFQDMGGDIAEDELRGIIGLSKPKPGEPVLEGHSAQMPGMPGDEFGGPATEGDEPPGPPDDGSPTGGPPDLSPQEFAQQAADGKLRFARWDESKHPRDEQGRFAWQMTSTEYEKERRNIQDQIAPHMAELNALRDKALKRHRELTASDDAYDNNADAIRENRQEHEDAKKLVDAKLAPLFDRLRGFEDPENTVLDPEGAHRRIVTKALKQGHPVPDHVLAEYPELSSEAKGWTPNNLHAAHGQQVYTKDGRLLKVEAAADGTWQIGFQKGLDPFSAADVLNKANAEVPKGLFGEESEQATKEHPRFVAQKGPKGGWFVRDQLTNDPRGPFDHARAKKLASELSAKHDPVTEEQLDTPIGEDLPVGKVPKGLKQEFDLKAKQGQASMFETGKPDRSGQGSLWDANKHPRETEFHGDKKPGEFAPKDQVAFMHKDNAHLGEVHEVTGTRAVVKVHSSEKRGGHKPGDKVSVPLESLQKSKFSLLAQWEEQKHPREKTTQPGGKHAGEFAPKNQGSAPQSTASAETPSGKPTKPWHMTKGDFVSQAKAELERITGEAAPEDFLTKASGFHQKHVEAAAAKGHSVPEYVLQDYPHVSQGRLPFPKQEAPSQPSKEKPSDHDGGHHQEEDDEGAARQTSQETPSVEQGQADADSQGSEPLTAETVKYVPLHYLPDPVKHAIQDRARAMLEHTESPRTKAALERILKDAGSDKGPAVEKQKEKIVDELTGEGNVAYSAEQLLDAHNEHVGNVSAMLKDARERYAQANPGKKLGRAMKQFNGGDYTTIPGFDTLARSLAGDYPALLGAGSAYSQDAPDDPTEGQERLFNYLSAGAPEKMTKAEAKKQVQGESGPLAAPDPVVAAFLHPDRETFLTEAAESIASGEPNPLAHRIAGYLKDKGGYVGQEGAEPEEYLNEARDMMEYMKYGAVAAPEATAKPWEQHGDDHNARIQSLYEHSGTDASTYDDIHAEMKRLHENLSKDQAIGLAKDLGIAGKIGSRKAAVAAIEKKLTGRKGSWERVKTIDSPDKTKASRQNRDAVVYEMAGSWYA